LDFKIDPSIIFRFFPLKEDKGHDDKCRQQENDRVFYNIAKKAGHGRTGFLGDGADHEVGGIADIAAGAEKNGTGRNRLQVMAFSVISRGTAWASVIPG
jgi:hypothetical protein